MRGPRQEEEILAGAYPAHHLTFVVCAKGGKVESLEKNEGQFAETWIEYQEGIHIFAVYFWHTQVWSVRIFEGLLGLRVIELVACDANMEPYEFSLEDSYNQFKALFMVTARGVTTYRAESAGHQALWTKCLITLW